MPRRRKRPIIVRLATSPLRVMRSGLAGLASLDTGRVSHTRSSNHRSSNHRSSDPKPPVRRLTKKQRVQQQLSEWTDDDERLSGHPDPLAPTFSEEHPVMYAIGFVTIKLIASIILLVVYAYIYIIIRIYQSIRYVITCLTSGDPNQRRII